MRFSEVPQELIRQCQKGVNQAFDTLYNLINRDLYASIFYFLRNHDDTDEVMQQVLIRLFRHIRHLEEPGKFAPWLWRMIINQCISYKKSERIKSGSASYDDALKGNGEDFIAELSNLQSPREVLINKEIKQKIVKAVQKLPRRQRMCFMLFEIEGYTLAEVAKFLGTSIGAVKFNLHEARLKLRQLLKDLEGLI